MLWYEPYENLYKMIIPASFEEHLHESIRIVNAKEPYSTAGNMPVRKIEN